MKIGLRLTFLLALVFIAVAIAKSTFFSHKIARRANALSATATLSSSEQWNEGVLSGAVSDSPPDAVTISLSPSQLDLQGMYQADSSRLTVNMDDANKANLFDGDTGTAWAASCSGTGCSANGSWLLELDSQYVISQFRVVRQVFLGSLYIDTSVDGTDFTTYVTTAGSVSDGWVTYNLSSPASANFIRVRIEGGGGVPSTWVGYGYEIMAFGIPLSATHISAPTQITSTNLYQWQTFTPTYTAPANTTISFKFRTSTDASSWTDWTSSQTVSSGSSLDLTSLITSKTGDPGEETFYKYIQVESTLTSSDGVSTPTLSDYTIGYHTNVPPDAPSNLSVVVGE